MRYSSLRQRPAELTAQKHFIVDPNLSFYIPYDCDVRILFRLVELQTPKSFQSVESNSV